MPSVESRRAARFRRKLEGGIEFWRNRGWFVVFLSLAVAYSKETGILRANPNYSVQRFIQKLRRKGIELEYSKVKERTAAGVENHAHLVVASKQPLPEKKQLKDAWAASTYGTSYQLETAPVKDSGIVSRYMAKAMGAYMAKQFPEPEGPPVPEGLDRATELQQRSRVSSYATFSRGWLPEGAMEKWTELFIENAVIWTCDRGFFHTDLRNTGELWLAWLRTRPPREKGARGRGENATLG